MKKVFKGLVIAAAVTMSAGVCLNAAADTAKLDQLLEQVKRTALLMLSWMLPAKLNSLLTVQTNKLY